MRWTVHKVTWRLDVEVASIYVMYRLNVIFLLYLNQKLRDFRLLDLLLCLKLQKRQISFGFEDNCWHNNERILFRLCLYFKRALVLLGRWFLSNILDIYIFFNFNLIFSILPSCINLFFRYETFFVIFLAFLIKTIIRKHELPIIFLESQLLNTPPFLIILYLLIDLVDVDHLLDNSLVFHFFCFYCLVISPGLVIGEFYNLVPYRFTIFSYILNQFFLLARSILVQRQLTTGTKYFGKSGGFDMLHLIRAIF